MNKCNTCKSKLIKISKSNHVNSHSKFTWESDSTFEILNLKEAKIYLAFCFRCFQATILPKFNTDLLYNEFATKIRKKYYEIYHPGKIYGYKDNSIFEKKFFKLASNELVRIQNISHLLSNTKISENKNYKILDYGGGSGFVSRTLSSIINGISEYNSSFHLYELEDWNGEEINNNLDEKYDLIILCHVLEHSHDAISIIEKCKKLLNKNGVIYCELPDERLNLIRSFYRKFGLHYHVSHHTRRSVNLIFRNSNFNFIKTHYFLHSSYQGVRMSIISCIASNDKKIMNLNEKLPSRFYEIMSFFYRIFFYFIKKIFLKTDNILK